MEPELFAAEDICLGCAHFEREDSDTGSSDVWGKCGIDVLEYAKMSTDPMSPNILVECSKFTPEYNYEDLPMTATVHKIVDVTFDLITSEVEPPKSFTTYEWIAGLTASMIHWHNTIHNRGITAAEIKRRVTAVVTCPNCADDLMCIDVDDGIAECVECGHEEETTEYYRCPCGNNRRSLLVNQGDDHRDGIKCAICGTLYTP